MSNYCSLDFVHNLQAGTCEEKHLHLTILRHSVLSNSK
jgi:hypothetical protein